MTTSPNLVVVVMDCVRAWDFPGGAEPVGGMPFVDSLRRESVTFPHAAAVAPWTMPSHASIFTGLYPWEHGMHGRHSMALSSAVPRISDLLRPLGYRSASVSANPLVCPTTHLATGFDQASWGNMFEMFLRLDHSTTAPRSFPAKAVATPTSPPLRQRILSRLPYDELPLRSMLERRVVVPTIAGRVLERLRDCDRDDAFDVARWIEPTISNFLRSTPPENPAFCFVNLLDAHEPYFGDPATHPNGEGWWGYARLRQDRLGWLSDPARRKGKDAEFIHALYRESIQRIDRRVAGIVKAFQEAGRWDNTCFILTADHGQAFGESGMIYHRFRVDDAQIRIPLIARFPHGQDGGATAQGWASLVDIAPTFFEAIGESAPVRFSGTALQHLVRTRRFDPIYAITDGTLGERWIPESRRAELDRSAVAVYRDSTKVIVQADPEAVQAFDVDADHRETRNIWPDRQEEFADLLSDARTILHQLNDQPRGVLSEDVSDRLKAWGYI